VQSTSAHLMLLTISDAITEKQIHTYSFRKILRDRGNTKISKNIKISTNRIRRLS